MGTSGYEWDTTTTVYDDDFEYNETSDKSIFSQW